jgi:hypothetical protein
MTSLQDLSCRMVGWSSGHPFLDVPCEVAATVPQSHAVWFVVGWFIACVLVLTCLLAIIGDIDEENTARETYRNHDDHYHC